MGGAGQIFQKSLMCNGWIWKCCNNLLMLAFNYVIIENHSQHLQLYAQKKMILLACWFRSIYAKAMCLLRLWPCYSTRRTNTVLCSAHILDGYLCTYSYYVNDVIKTSIQTRFIWWSVCIINVLWLLGLLVRCKDTHQTKRKSTASLVHCFILNCLV